MIKLEMIQIAEKKKKKTLNENWTVQLALINYNDVES